MTISHLVATIAFETPIIWIVTHTCPIEALESNLRAAVKAFLETPDGQAIIEENCGAFNWGDAVIHIPTDILNSYEIVEIDRIDPVIELDHDEDLAPYH